MRGAFVAAVFVFVDVGERIVAGAMRFVIVLRALRSAQQMRVSGSHGK